MATQKFVYTVSGVDLTDAQKTKISQEIAAVVARAVMGESHKTIQPDLLTLHGIAGGRLIPSTEAKGGITMEAFFKGGCGGGTHE